MIDDAYKFRLGGAPIISRRDRDDELREVKPIEKSSKDKSQSVEVRRQRQEEDVETDDIISTPEEAEEIKEAKTEKLPEEEETKAEEDTKKPEMVSMYHGGIMSVPTMTGIDPVSGNPIPLGASASNVRDDIPAALSEGEYVARADVVRWHGLKTYMAMQKEAELGLMMMAEMGQIKGPEYSSEEAMAPEMNQIICPECDGIGCEHCDMTGYHTVEASSDDIEPASVEVVEEEMVLEKDSEGIQEYPSEMGQESSVCGSSEVLLIFGTPEQTIH